MKRKLIRITTMERVVEISEDDEDDTIKEDTMISPGVGVVRIHSIELKGKVINTTRYLKMNLHSDPRHIRHIHKFTTNGARDGR
jgi:hypothetical protein